MEAARALRSILRLLIVIALAWAAGVVIFGPFAVQWGPLKLSSRDATRASLAAAALIAAYARTAGLAQLRLDVANVTSGAARYASPMAAAVGVFVFALGVRH